MCNSSACNSYFLTSSVTPAIHWHLPLKFDPCTVREQENIVNRSSYLSRCVVNGDINKRLSLTINAALHTSLMMHQDFSKEQDSLWNCLLIKNGMIFHFSQKELQIIKWIKAILKIDNGSSLCVSHHKSTFCEYSCVSVQHSAEDTRKVWQTKTWNWVTAFTAQRHANEM